MLGVLEADVGVACLALPLHYRLHGATAAGCTAPTFADLCHGLAKFDDGRGKNFMSPTRIELVTFSALSSSSNAIAGFKLVRLTS